MSSRPAIVLLHGAWHQPSHWSIVTAQLQSRGYEYQTPALPSATSTRVDDPFAKDVALIKETLGRYTKSGKDVVLVMHSYAGVTGSEAIAEFQKDAGNNKEGDGRVLGLFYICSLILEPGSSLITDGSTPHAWDIEGDLIYNLEPYNRFYNTTPSHIARKAIEQIVPQSLHSFTVEVKERGYADYGLPVTYLACKQDRALLYDHDLVRYQKRLQDAGIRDLSIRTIDCDHTPWMSTEEEFFTVFWEVLHKAEQTAASKR